MHAYTYLLLELLQAEPRRARDGGQFFPEQQQVRLELRRPLHERVRKIVVPAGGRRPLNGAPGPPARQAKFVQNKTKNVNKLSTKHTRTHTQQTAREEDNTW